MDCPYAKSYRFIFSRFGFIVRTDRQNHYADDRYTHTTTGCVKIKRPNTKTANVKRFKPGFHYPS